MPTELRLLDVSVYAQRKALLLVPFLITSGSSRLETWRVGDERIDSPLLVQFIVR